MSCGDDTPMMVPSAAREELDVLAYESRNLPTVSGGVGD